ncbi:uncharacterized protein LOC115212127 [Octopus sinensis]|uniref:Uncharacterized protein LOC115212127 n=1 Tax=Octopus sinensis TaxID=2607531 RepID=A0A7E6EUI7_9MOLL|nr:uncharacterized protein LOC115212127 [Octopus sinensis]
MSLPNLPPYSGDVTLWFAQLDAYFSAHAVPHQQQLNLLYCGMPSPLARSVKDLITDPHPDATYVSMKSEVLRWNTQSAESKFQTLMQDEHLRDRTPSEFLHWLRELSNIPLEDNLLLRKLFSSCLPLNVQSILATTAMVDKIIELTVQPALHHTCSDPLVASPTTTKSPASSYDNILERVDALTCCMDTLWQEHTSS